MVSPLAESSKIHTSDHVSTPLNSFECSNHFSEASDFNAELSSNAATDSNSINKTGEVFGDIKFTSKSKYMSRGTDADEMTGGERRELIHETKNLQACIASDRAHVGKVVKDIERMRYALNEAAVQKIKMDQQAVSHHDMASHAAVHASRGGFARGGRGGRGGAFLGRGGTMVSTYQLPPGPETFLFNMATRGNGRGGFPGGRGGQGGGSGSDLWEATPEW